MPAPLTDREWYLVKNTYATTLKALLGTCEKTGMPGRVVIDQLLVQYAAGEGEKYLRTGAERFLEDYKSDAC